METTHLNFNNQKNASIDGGDKGRFFHFYTSQGTSATANNSFMEVQVFDYEITTIPEPDIVDVSVISNNVFKVVVDAPAALYRYYPVYKPDLMASTPWTNIAHSRDATGPFLITSLTYSSTEGTNVAFYLEADASKGFFRLNISKNETLSVDDFGAVGDGVNDDIDSVVSAVNALKNAGEGAVLEFTPGKVYKLGLRNDSIFQIDLQGFTNATVNGNGAMLLNTPEQATIRVKRCKDVTVENFVIEQSPLSYSQGIITYIHPSGEYFEMETMEGFPLSIEAQNAAISNFWDWGAIIDPDLKRIRPDDTSNHYFIDGITNLTGNLFRVYVATSYQYELKRNGQIADIWFQPLQFNSAARLEQIGGGRYASNIHVTQSSDILMRDIALFSGRSSMCNTVDFNHGPVTYRGFTVMIPPSETNRMVSSWRDGIHCKNNRVGPVIEDCYFSALLDDSVNLSQIAARATEVVTGTTNRTFRLAFEGWAADASHTWVGDDIMVFHPATGEYVGPVKVVGVDSANPRIITFESSIANVVMVGDGDASHFYNMDACNAGFVVRDNNFLPQRRHAILVRSVDGLIEDNYIDGVGGSGIVVENDLQYFVGPFPISPVTQNVPLAVTSKCTTCEAS